MYYRMEVVWHGEFDRLFGTFDKLFGQKWYLCASELYPAINLAELKPPDWHELKDSAKVRFCCEVCGHGWTSMKGRVYFWICLTQRNQGHIVFKLFGQQCQRCNDGNFYHAMWYPEEVMKVIQNLYNFTSHLYYGSPYYIPNAGRRIGKPTQQHNANLCQACEMGLCKGEWACT